MAEGVRQGAAMSALPPFVADAPPIGGPKASVPHCDFADRIDQVARRLLGDPNPRHSSRDEWRYGTNGSLSVKVGGEHRGTWRDHETGTGGGVLDLIVRERGGDRKDAVEWLKAEFSDIAGRSEPAGERRIAAVYGYTDEAGELLFEVVRYAPQKDFRQRRPDGRGGHVWNLKDTRIVPYRLPETLEALALGKTVAIVEGEKDADRLAKLGIPATCNPGGAGKWRDEFGALFDGADVIILPDNDDAGRDHAERVAKSLASHAARIRVVELPDLPRKGDVSDFLNRGGTVEALLDIVEHAPPWRPKAVTRFPSIRYGDEDSAPPLRWLVKGLLPEAGLSTVYGPPGTSKTFVALDLALHVAHGRDWFERRTEPGGVLYVSGEGASGMLLRMKAWRQEKGDGTRAPFVPVPSSVNLYDEEGDVDVLIDDVKAHGAALGVPVRLIVLDTLSRMIGSGDEDKARDINMVVQRAEHVQRETGAHVLIVHHSGKDRDRGMRGSNALLGAVDASIEVSRHEESGICEGKIAKVKDGTAVAPFRYTLRQSVLGTDEDGEDITSCVVEPTDASPGESKGKRPLSATEKIALDALDEALLADGVASPTALVPQGYRAVHIETWRSHAYRRGIAEGTEEAKKKAFQRVRQSLQAKRIVGIDGDWAWRA
ncbi:AAA family ATPase [Blastochloris tepida]|nr:AAA family ATPase [Blastochloris tepida]